VGDVRIAPCLPVPSRITREEKGEWLALQRCNWRVQSALCWCGEIAYVPRRETPCRSGIVLLLLYHTENTNFFDLHPTYPCNEKQYCCILLTPNLPGGLQSGRLVILAPPETLLHFYCLLSIVYCTFIRFSLLRQRSDMHHQPMNSMRT